MYTIDVKIIIAFCIFIISSSYLLYRWHIVLLSLFKKAFIVIFKEACRFQLNQRRNSAIKYCKSMIDGYIDYGNDLNYSENDRIKSFNNATIYENALSLMQYEKSLIEIGKTK